MQGQRFVSVVGIDDRPGDEVLGLVHAVPQLCRKPTGILQEHGQRFHTGTVPEHRQPGQLGFADMHFSTVEHERCRFRAVGIFRDDRRGAVVRRTGTGKLLRQQVRPAAGVAMRCAGVGKVRRIIRQTGAVIGM